MGNKKKSFRNNKRKNKYHSNSKNNQKNSDQKKYNENNYNKTNKKEVKFVSTNVERKQKNINNNTNQNKFNRKLNQKQKKQLPKNMDIFNKLEIKENHKITKFRNKYKKFNAKPRRTIIPYKINKLDKEICHICNKPIEDMTTSIIDKNSGEFVHFNCLVARIKKIKGIPPKENVVYLGSGTFGIIEITDSKKKTFKIKETIY